MKQIRKPLLTLLALGLALSSHAVAPDTRYNTIVDRNIFRLTSPPPPPPTTTTNEVLEKNIELSGITTIDGQKKAWFIVKPKTPGKDLPQYLSLAENERQEFLEVVSISESKGEVKVVNSGNPMTLSFENNKPKAVAGAAPGPAGVPPGSPAGNPAGGPPANVIAQPQGANPLGNAAAPNAASGYGGRSVTVAGGVQQPAVGQANPAGQANNMQPNAGGFTQIPSRQVRLTPQQPVGSDPTGAQQKPVDPVLQRALMEIQQEQAKQTGSRLPPLPPLPQ